jgi:hypothetical protein
LGSLSGVVYSLELRVEGWDETDECDEWAERDGPDGSEGLDETV